MGGLLNLVSGASPDTSHTCTCSYSSCACCATGVGKTTTTYIYCDTGTPCGSSTGPCGSCYNSNCG